jgi:hypothetical protein
MALAMLAVGVLALLLVALLPAGRTGAIAALAVPAALGLGVGTAWLVRALAQARRPPGEDLARLLSPAFGDGYVLVLSPRLPGVSADLAALLVGPPGVRAVVTRRWRGRYRVRDRAWEYDARGRTGWIPCRTNPSFEADAVARAVADWAGEATDEVTAVKAVVAFPLPMSRIVLEEPDGEIITSDNAPWYAQRIGRVQRMDAARVGRFVQAVVDAGDAPMPASDGRPALPQPQR